MNMCRSSRLQLVMKMALFLCCARQDPVTECAAHVDPCSIHLRAEIINACAGVPGRRRHRRRSTGEQANADLENSVRTYFVHLGDAGNEQHRRAVSEAAGQRLERFIPHNTFLLDLSPYALQRTQALVGSSVLWMGELEPHHKLASAALQNLVATLHQHHLHSGSRQQTDIVLVARMRAANALALVSPYERALCLAGFAVSVKASGKHTLHIRQITLQQPGMCADRGEHSTKGHSRVVTEATKDGAQELWVQGVAAWLAAQHDVIWIEPKARLSARNKYAAMIVQGGFERGQRVCLPCAYSACPNCSRTDTASTPIWNMGLKGQGEVIGVGDTGIDVDSCFFWDSNGGSRPGPPLAPVKSTTHRKIVSYQGGHGAGTGDASDGVRGHGTHVVGSIVGSVDAAFKPGDEISQHSGMAPSAKVAFFDLESGGQGLDVPDDLGEDYFRWAYEAGARIHSNSWGDSSNEYTLLTADTDDFVWHHPDLLVLFAAGNDGDKDEPAHTVGAPATCKNCLSVGASQSDERDALADGNRLEVILKSQAGTQNVIGEYLASSASFGPALDKLMHGEISFASFLGKACEPLGKNETAPFQDKQLIAVVQRGTCVFVDKVRHAQEAGAVAVIVTNSVEGDPIAMGGDDESVTIPAVMISKEDGQRMYNLTRDSPGQQLSLELTVARSLPSFHQDNLAAFSSLGPTSDGRLKPDIVAPGEDVHSAYSDGQAYSYQCEADGKSARAALTRMSGTSMSTPIVAGSAALVRQYFREKYLSAAGTAGTWMLQEDADGFQPSAALLRAVLINGAQDLSQMLGRRGSSGDLLLPAPSMQTGYGRINLVESLQVPSVATSPSLVVLDAPAQSSLSTTETARVAQGQVKRHCVKVGASAVRPLKITLAWTDPPSLPNSAEALVHDLDLVLYHRESDTLLYGNHRLRDGSDVVTDTLNPTEQVIVDEPAVDSVYVVYVLGTRVVRERFVDGSVEELKFRGQTSGRAETSVQDYALSITGSQLEALSATDPICESVDCPRNCSGHGRCDEGKCMCTGAFWGADCALLKSCPMGEGGIVCSGHGSCEIEQATCQCADGFSGRACQQFACISGTVTNLTVSLSREILVESCSEGSTYNQLAACAWQLFPEAAGGVYLMASLERLQVESQGFLFPMAPGCDGRKDCADKCSYDALHVVHGRLERANTSLLSSDNQGQPCHDWAQSHPGYAGTFCGDLDWISSDGEPLALPFLARNQPLSLVFCSDIGVQPGSGFAVRVAAVPCPHNCSGHGSCGEVQQASVAEPGCDCQEGWDGDFCEHQSVHCDPQKSPMHDVSTGDGAFNVSAGRTVQGKYVCVELDEFADYGRPLHPDGSWISDVRPMGLLVCAPGYSGESCEKPYCDGYLNLTWSTAHIASHDGNHSRMYRNGTNCRWLYPVKAARPSIGPNNSDLFLHNLAMVNITFLDLEYQHDYLEIVCVTQQNDTKRLVGRFSGATPCSDKSCWRGGGGTECRDSRERCVAQREWKWLALQVHNSWCPWLELTFSSDNSKSARGFSAVISRQSTSEPLLRPFVEATITFFNHSIADIHGKTKSILSAVARAAQVTELDVAMTQAVGHLDVRKWSVPAQSAVLTVDKKRAGRRPVQDDIEHQHRHVTVTVQVFAHKTDAPEPSAWAIYHRLARQTHHSSPVSPTPNSDDFPFGQEALWVWETEGEGQVEIWKESEGEGSTLIQTLKASDAGFDRLALRMLRVSISGAALPLYYEYDNQTTSERIVEILRHASARDTAFYFIGVLSVLLLAGLICTALWLKSRWLVRRQYKTQVDETELEDIGATVRREHSLEAQDCPPAPVPQRAALLWGLGRTRPVDRIEEHECAS